MSTVELNPIQRLTKDLKTASVTLSVDEVRFIVNYYYQIQENRKASANQVRSLVKEDKPHELISWLEGNMENLESQIKRALDTWSSSKELGVWVKSIVGIGPVIASGLMAHINIEAAPTAGHIWSYAGMYGPAIEYDGCDPKTVIKWNKGEKRPWNADLKTLCWKVGESFVKVCNNEQDVYGKIYIQRKEQEIERNDKGIFIPQAVAKLNKFKIGKDTDAYAWYSGCYEAGMPRIYADTISEKRLELLKKNKLKPGEGQPMLPPAHIQARAKRKAVMLFLSHYHHVAYIMHYKKMPPKPFVEEHLGHVHIIQPKNFEAKKYLS
jgi:hypothetical protein